MDSYCNLVDITGPYYFLEKEKAIQVADTIDKPCNSASIGICRTRQYVFVGGFYI